MSNSLATQSWIEASLHEVYLAFLKAEHHHLTSRTAKDLAAKLVENPDLADAEENFNRFALLVAIRGALLQWIPCSTKWCLVRFLKQEHLEQLRVIARCGWDSPTRSDGNELLSVARRERIQLRDRPDVWAPPILWGHAKDGPLTILEGNKRLLAYAIADPRPRLETPVYVGLSEDLCVLHYLDPALPAVSNSART